LRHIRSAVAAATFALVAASPAVAQETPPSSSASSEVDFSGDSLTIGLGAAFVPEYEGSNDYDILPAPGAIGSYKGYSFLVAGNRFSADLIRADANSDWDLQLGPVGVLSLNRNALSAISDPRVRALGKRDVAIELGGYAGIGKTGIITSPYDKLSFTVSYRYDVNGAHSSGILAPTATYLTPLSRKAAVGVFVSGERVERGYTAAYFNVSPNQSIASGLPVYNGRGGWKNYTLGGFGTVALTGDLLHGFKLVAGGTYRRLLNDVGDSPLVSIAGSRNQWLGAVGLAYTF
jgi:MipA family protein